MEFWFQISTKDKLLVKEEGEYYLVEHIPCGLYYLPNDVSEVRLPVEMMKQELKPSKGVVLIWTPIEGIREAIWMELLNLPFKFYAKEVNWGGGIYVAYIFKSNSMEWRPGSTFVISKNENLEELPKDFKPLFLYTFPIMPDDIFFYVVDEPLSVTEEAVLKEKKLAKKFMLDAGLKEVSKFEEKCDYILKSFLRRVKEFEGNN